MENAAKALLIAAGVLVGLIVLSMLVVGYRQISSYYQSKEASKIQEQLADFNEQYMQYNRDNVRGSDLLSLINKIVDFNTLSDEEDITISINMSGANNIYYGGSRPNDSKKRLIDIKNPYNKDTIRTVVYNANDIENKYSQALATKLAANMSTLMGENSRKDKKDLLVELKIMKMSDTNPDNFVNNDEILKYYQYVQFKRAHFNCKSLEYTKQGRVKNLTFEFNGKFE